MVYTVTLNPCIDLFACAGDISPGGVHRYYETGFYPGGKGINVSVMLNLLGVENLALGLAGGFTGKELIRMLSCDRIASDFVILPEGNTRINLNLNSPGTLETAFNGSGPDIPDDAIASLLKKLSTVESGDTLVLAGSVPPAVPENIYAEIIRSLNGSGIRICVDTSGEPLRDAVRERPWLIKPNLKELGDLFGAEISGIEGVRECAAALREEGARNIAVSMGERGAMLFTEDGPALFCRAPKGKAVSAVGAGDAFLAGFLYGMRLHGTYSGALSWGVACGSATAFSQRFPKRDEIFSTLQKVGNVYPI